MENNKDLKKEVTQDDLESMELLQRSKERQGLQIRMDLDTGTLSEIDELRQLLGKQAEDPEEKYSIYYTGIRNILMKYLPKGKENEELRQLIYDEKNVFLNRGKRKSDNDGIRGSDGRMTYQEYMSEMLDEITKWVSESQVPLDLYHMLYGLNEKHGYGHEEYDKTSLKYRLAVSMQNEK